MALAIVGTLALGVGCLAAGAIDVFERRPDYLALRLLAGVGLVAVVMARRLNARTVAQCPLPRVGLRHPRGTR